MNSPQTSGADAQPIIENLAALLGFASRQLTEIPENPDMGVANWAYAAQHLLSKNIVSGSFQRVEASSLEPCSAAQGTLISDPDQLIVLPLFGETNKAPWCVEREVLSKAVTNMAEKGIEAFRVTWRTPPPPHTAKGFRVDATHFGLAIDSRAPDLEEKLVSHAMTTVERGFRDQLRILDRDLPSTYWHGANARLLELVQGRLGKVEAEV